MIPIGREAKNWVCAAANDSSIKLRHKTQLVWQAFWFDINWRLQEKHAVRYPLSSDPVFIIGLWRSGTTHLHNLLSNHPAFIAPATWQCMAVSTFASRGPPKQSASLRRPMDHHVIETWSPQEDEFALMALGIPSAYLSFFRPDRLVELEYTVEPRYWLQEHENKWYEKWLHFLEMLPNTGQKRLIVKSPNHTFRVPSLAKLFPDAKWIFMYRRMEPCLFSNRKMWKMMFDKHSVATTRPSTLDNFLASACDGVVNSLEWAGERLGSSSMISVNLDDLSSNPLPTILRLAEFLEVECHEDFLKSITLNRAKPLRGSFCNYGTEPLSDRLRAASQRLTEKHLELFGRCVPENA